MKRNILILLIALVLIVSAIACTQSFETITKRDFALDTLCEIKIYSEEQVEQDEDVNQILDESISLIKELESIMSAHEENSDIYLLNKNAGKQEVTIDERTYEVLKQSIAYSELTEGFFDITSGPLIELWNIDPPNGYVPTEEEKSQAISKIDYTKLDLLENNKAYLVDEDMGVDLGAIAKGYIANSVKEKLVADGVTSCVINLGGNTLLIGGKPDGSDFNIGIQDPNDDRNEYLLSVAISDKAIVTSGDYERYFEQDGIRYHHILNPKTGMPASTNINQVTIIAENSLVADSLSTCVLLLGVEKGLDIIESQGVGAVIITNDKKIYITQNIQKSCTLQQKTASEKGYTVTTNIQDLF